MSAEKKILEDDKWVKSMLTAVSGQSVLWDENDKGYYSSKARNRAWSVVMAKLNRAGYRNSSETLRKRFRSLQQFYLKRQRKGGAGDSRMTKNSRFLKYLTFLDGPVVRNASTRHCRVDQPQSVSTSLPVDQAEKALIDRLQSLPAEKAEQHRRYQTLKEQYSNLLITETKYKRDWHKINLQQEHTRDKARSNAAARKSRRNGKLVLAGLGKDNIVLEMAVLRKMMESSGDIADYDDGGRHNDERQAQDSPLPLRNVDSPENVESLQSDLFGDNEWRENNIDERISFLQQLFASDELISEELNVLKQRLFVLIKCWRDLRLTKQRKCAIDETAELKTGRTRQKPLIEEEIQRVEFQINCAAKDIEIQQLRENIAALEETVQDRDSEIRRLNASVSQNLVHRLHLDDTAIITDDVDDQVELAALPAGASDFVAE